MTLTSGTLQLIRTGWQPQDLEVAIEHCLRVARLLRDWGSEGDALARVARTDPVAGVRRVALETLQAIRTIEARLSPEQGGALSIAEDAGVELSIASNNDTDH